MKNQIFYLLLALLAAMTSVRADDFLVNSTSCKVFHMENHQWKPVEPKTVSEIFGDKSVKRNGHFLTGYPDRVVLHQGNESYLFPATCTQKVAIVTASATPAAPEKKIPHRGSFYLTASYLSWQESASISSPTGQSYDLHATSRAVCLGADWRKPISPKLEYDISGCWIFGNTDIGSPSTANQPTTPYSADGSSVSGVDAEVGLDFKPGTGKITVGPRLAFLYRSASWPPAASGYTLSSSTGMLPAILVQSKYDVGSFYVAPSLGFIKSASNFFWSLGLGFRLSRPSD